MLERCFLIVNRIYEFCDFDFKIILKNREMKRFCFVHVGISGILFHFYQNIVWLNVIGPTRYFENMKIG